MCRRRYLDPCIAGLVGFEYLLKSFHMLLVLGGCATVSTSTTGLVSFQSAVVKDLRLVRTIDSRLLPRVRIRLFLSKYPDPDPVQPSCICSCRADTVPGANDVGSMEDNSVYRRDKVALNSSTTSHACAWKRNKISTPRSRSQWP